MGKSVQQLTDKVSLIASESTWIEGAAIQQLIKISELTGMVSVAGMPDLHPGRGYPIGAAFYSQDRIYPALVGNDIGCGMALWQAHLKLSKTNAEKLASKLSDMESPLDESWQDTISARKRDKQIEGDAFERSLGTIGGGNHFAEFQQIDEIYCAEAMSKLGLDKKRLQLLVHSGSRGLGQSILVEHVQRFNHDGLSCDTQEFEQYMAQHDHAVRWAELNRELIARRFFGGYSIRWRAGPGCEPQPGGFQAIGR